jgi:Fe2+ or Zn2+ uptake regulation protein
VKREDDGEHLHAHFSCRACGHVSCLEEAVLPRPEKSEWQESLMTAEVQVVGVCPPCLRLSNA